MRTSGLLRIRLALPESGRDMTYSLPFSSPNETGVGKAAPFCGKRPKPRCISGLQSVRVWRAAKLFALYENDQGIQS